jgi:mannose-6-phosphate isomerase-like protein (cupin superfamily)
MAHRLLNKQDLARAEGTGTATFEGHLYGGIPLSFFWVDLPPGRGARLHRHPYEETFLVQEGRARFTIDSTTLDVTAGQIVIVPAHTPHAFSNVGEGPLRQIDILPSEHIVTEWLEE